MSDSVASTVLAAANTAAYGAATGITVFGVATGLQFDVLVAGAAGGVTALTYMGAMHAGWRIGSVISSAVMAGYVSPVIAMGLSKFPLVSGGDPSIYRVCAGMLVGFAAHLLLLPGLLSFGKAWSKKQEDKLNG